MGEKKSACFDRPGPGHIELDLRSQMEGGGVMEVSLASENDGAKKRRWRIYLDRDRFYSL